MADDGQENRLIAERRAKLTRLREAGNAYPNDFRRNALADELQKAYGAHSAESLAATPVEARVAGRLMVKRVMGGTSFVKLQDRTGQIQLMVKRDRVGEAFYAEFKKWDVGDVVAARGELIKTKTGELSVDAAELRLLVKSLRPLPEKWHGITDAEMKLRQRYVDLIMSEETREVFRRRSVLSRFVRSYLDALDFTEVETPMMQPIPGGATARPFVTYQTYAGPRDLMALTENLLRGAAHALTGSTDVEYQGERFDLAPKFAEITVEAALERAHPSLAGRMRDRAALADVCAAHGVDVRPELGAGRLQYDLFEKTVEATLRGPVFVLEYPAEVSPLARCNDSDPFVTDRFELFVGGRELANGFAELNDPEEQAARFHAQVAAKAGGDEEAMFFDADFIRALEYGMPPAAGLGIGIDRVAMLLTNSPSIRDVLLFPQLKAES